VQKVVAKQLTQ
jgi:hypothetical protein